MVIYYESKFYSNLKHLTKKNIKSVGRPDYRVGLGTIMKSILSDPDPFVSVHFGLSNSGSYKSAKIMENSQQNLSKSYDYHIFERIESLTHINN